MKTKILILALALTLSLGVVGVTLANGGVERLRWVLSGGASDSAAEGVAMRATLGQPVVGGITSSSGDVILGQGFWCGTTLRYNIYLPLVTHE